MAEKSRILIIGGTGYIGKFVVEASAKSGNPTFVLVRRTATSSPQKSQVLENFKNHGVTIIYGDMYDHENLVKAVKQVDVVISTVGSEQLADQDKIIAAIKEAGNIKRFLPSEFGIDVDRVHAVEPAASFFRVKTQIRRKIETEGIPYTYVANNGFLEYWISSLSLSQGNFTGPPRDKMVILGDGTPKAIYVKEEDIATYTIKAIDDPRTLNKILYMRLPGNVLSFNDLVSMWEKKIGKTLEKTYVLEDQLLKDIEEAEMPNKLILAIGYSAYVKGDDTNFEIEASFGVEASDLYPDVKHTTVEEYLDQYV